MDLVRALHALSFSVPLAILAGATVSPPDPFSQLSWIALGVVLFVPAAYASVAATATSRTLVAFFLAVLATMVLGGVAIAVLGGGGTGRVLVLAVAVAFGAATATRYG